MYSNYFFYLYFILVFQGSRSDFGLGAFKFLRNFNEPEMFYRGSSY